MSGAGYMRRRYVVECRECYAEITSNSDKKLASITEFLAQGWRVIDSREYRWTCNNCIDRKETRDE